MKISSLYRDELQFYMVYMEENFFQRCFALYLQNPKEFISIPYCLMDFCIHPILMFFAVFFFFFFFFFLLNKALLVIVWNNLDSNSEEY